MKIESNVLNKVEPKPQLMDLVSNIVNKRNKEVEEASNKYDIIQNHVENKGTIIDVRV